MIARTASVIAIVLLTGCDRGDGSTVGLNTALYRIERGGYAVIELRPQYLRLRTADGQVQTASWRGGQMSPHQKSEVGMRVLKARARGFELTYISSG